MKRARFLAMRRALGEGRWPTSVMFVGRRAPATDAMTVARGDDCIEVTTAPELADALRLQHTGRLVVLCRQIPEPDYGALDAVRLLSPALGTTLLAWSPRAPHEAWGQVFSRVVSTNLNEGDTEAWVQMLLGGAISTTARGVLDRVGWDIDAAAEAVARLLLVTDGPTPRDVGEVVDPEPVLHFADALLRCKRSKALELAPRVRTPAPALRRLEFSVGQLWTLGEVRPLSQLNNARELGLRIGMEPSDIRRLAPIMRFYSRQKIAQRYQALAVTEELLRQHGPAPGLLESLCASW